MVAIELDLGMKVFQHLSERCRNHLRLRFGFRPENYATAFAPDGTAFLQTCGDAVRDIAEVVRVIRSENTTNTLLVGMLEFDPPQNFISSRAYAEHVCCLLNKTIVIKTAPNARETIRVDIPPSQCPAASPPVSPAPKPPTCVSPCSARASHTLEMHPMFVPQEDPANFFPDGKLFTPGERKYVLPNINTRTINTPIEINTVTHFFEQDSTGFLLPISLGKLPVAIRFPEPLIIFTPVKPSSPRLIENIVRFLERKGNAINSLVEYLRLFKKHDDVEMTGETIPLACPMSMLKMRHPLLIRSCSHHLDASSLCRRFFDAESEKHQCPTCKAKFELAELVVNRWLRQVVEEAPETAEYVQFSTADDVQYLDTQKDPLSKRVSIVVVPEDVTIDD